MELKQNIVIGCEYSNVVADAFRSQGHDVVSVDIIENDCKKLSSGQHIVGDIFEYLEYRYKFGYKIDKAIFFPPCTYLCRAQAHLLKDPERHIKHLEAIEFVRQLWSQPIEQIAIENPIGFLSTKWQKPNQITTFNNFGDPYSKDICLWLKNLPVLRSTNIVPGTRKVSNHVNSRMSQALKSKIKSKFFPGIAKAMSEQW